MRASSRSPLPRQLSYNQIAVSHEVSVVTSYSDATRESSVGRSLRRPSLEQSRSNSAGGFRAPSMTSALSGRVQDELYPGAPQERSYTLSGRPSRDIDRDRQSLRELAEFLRTKEPPKNNWMSRPDPYDEPHSKYPFKLFGRRGSKKSKPPRPMKLPDSAVAAKTIEGHWHIAISIPNEHDLLDGTPSSGGSTPSGQKRTNPGTLHSSRDGPITVLKPVNEDRPLSVGTEFNAAAIVSRLFQDVQEEEEGLQEIPRPKSGVIPPTSTTFAGKQRAYIGLSPEELRPQQTQSLEQRTSPEDAPRERTIDRARGQPQTWGKVTTVPSTTANAFINLRGIEPPARFSSKTGPINLDSVFPDSMVAESSSQDRFRDSTQSVRSVAESIASDVSDGRIGVADTARNPGSPDIINGPVLRQMPRSFIKTAKMPDLPEHTEDNRSDTQHAVQADDRDTSDHSNLRLVSSARDTVANDAFSEPDPPILSHVSPKASSLSSAISPTASVKERNATGREQRQERVKALRSRDIAALKERNRIRGSVLLESPNTAKPRRPSTPPPSNLGKRRSVSASPSPPKADIKRKGENALTKIMLVVDVPPDYELPQKATSVPQRDSKGAGARDSRNGTHTPPRSPTPSFASSDEEAAYSMPRILGATPKHMGHSRNNSSEQRLQRAINASLPEGAHDKSAEFEERLARIEKNNATMMRTLSAVLEMGKGLGDLTRHLPSRGGQTIDEEARMERMVSSHVGRGLGEIEPLMMELRGASRISQEGARPDSFGLEGDFGEEEF